jgi:hypothetical protein
MAPSVLLAWPGLKAGVLAWLFGAHGPDISRMGTVPGAYGGLGLPRPASHGKPWLCSTRLERQAQTAQETCIQELCKL